MKQENGYKKGFWTKEEDKILTGYARKHGEGRWNRVTKMTGLRRCGKSCRLRWINYLCPSVNRDDFSEEEDDLIIRLHNLLGNRWSLIAGRLPGRTDNQVKNHWNTRLRKKLGINKEENKVRASSRAIPKTVRENFNNSLQTNLGALLPNPNGNQEATNQKPVLENDSMSTIRFLDSLQMTMNDESSFWFPDGDLGLNNPNFEELLDQNALDFVWNGF
ncbi:unnamed protein product [Ilex paraguariensis]|uniref:Uncharacterized protein n=1 Tax=Ilex paraguariensis TaxID=185542 RepID=A0ABC8S636_9AQUA